MNAVEIEAAVSTLALQPFDGVEFPFAFLTAFGNKETTIKRLRKGETNASDLPGGVLQRNNIHIVVCEPGDIGETLKALRESPKTTAAKAKFILATDGQTVEAEDMISGETIASTYTDLAEHFGFFLPLAGISTIKEIKDNPIDVRATGRLNKLYVELLKHNPDWATEARQHDMNHFMARLIFCFFAEDTYIFDTKGRFTETVSTMSERDASNTDEIVSAIFRAMNTKGEDRHGAGVPGWADRFPYVNGGLFSGSTEVPRFSRMARSYLLHAGELSWRNINPDIFGSMIQAVADDEERGTLGLHYTSVPNILKVLNPLFLDDLRAQLAAAGKNARMLLNLRRRMARIRVFDPACGSGNFLVIAYKQMREIEATINGRRDEPQLRTEIPLTNFRGIELRDFPAEIARLSLIIAEYQCDVLYRGQKEALAEFLPLDAMNWITCGNALRLDWLSICPPTGSNVKFTADDLFRTPLDQAQIDFENEGGETYICGNPPYSGGKLQTAAQKSDLEHVFSPHSDRWPSLDYVAGWLFKAADFMRVTGASAALVTTNSICQGQQVPILWPLLFGQGVKIGFAHTSFRWSNLASRKAVVTVAIVGLVPHGSTGSARLYEESTEAQTAVRVVPNINAYLIAGPDVIVQPASEPINGLPEMVFGNMPRDDGNLLLTVEEKRTIEAEYANASKYLRLLQGSEDLIQGGCRACIWVTEDDYELARQVPILRTRMEAVAEARRKMKAASTQKFAAKPYRFVQIQGQAKRLSIIVPRHSSEARPYLPVGLAGNNVIVADSALAIYDSPLWSFSIICSRLHLIWVASVCGKIKMDYRYSNTIGWNTFPIPILTEQNKADLTRCGEDVLLAREDHFPATIADLYNADSMPDGLRHAHDRNDEVLERIYIGRRFRNDTERLEKLFDLYTKMTAQPAATKRRKAHNDRG
jgi:hypothetical protein